MSPEFDGTVSEMETTGGRGIAGCDGRGGEGSGVGAVSCTHLIEERRGRGEGGKEGRGEGRKEGRRKERKEGEIGGGREGEREGRRKEWREREMGERRERGKEGECKGRRDGRKRNRIGEIIARV